MRRQLLLTLLAAWACAAACWSAAAAAGGGDTAAPAFTPPRTIDASPAADWPRDFDAAAYLAYNLDVAKHLPVPNGAGPQQRAAAAWAHYRRNGFKEGRIYTRIPVVLG
jgi:hypothetical protein